MARPPVVTMTHSPFTCQGSNNHAGRCREEMRRRNKLWPEVEVISHAGNDCNPEQWQGSHCWQSSFAWQSFCQRCSLGRQLLDTCVDTTIAACCPAVSKVLGKQQPGTAGLTGQLP